MAYQPNTPRHKEEMPIDKVYLIYTYDQHEHQSLYKIAQTKYKAEELKQQLKAKINVLEGLFEERHSISIKTARDLVYDDDNMFEDKYDEIYSWLILFAAEFPEIGIVNIEIIEKEIE